VASLTPRRSAFDPSPVHVEFVVPEEAMGEILFRGLLLPLVSTIPAMLLTQITFTCHRRYVMFDACMLDKK
jgi:hypothetical protein